MFSPPVVLAVEPNADLPQAVLLVPVVFASNAIAPKDIFCTSCVSFKAAFPTATLLSPDVF